MSSVDKPGTQGAEQKEPEIDRIVPNVVAPPSWPLTKAKLFGSDGKPNIEVLREHLLKEGRLEMDAAIELITRCGALFKEEPNLLKLSFGTTGITVCGDIHGQFFDMKKLLEIGGDPGSTQYLFLGDYVDRGCFATEVIFYMYAMKILHPQSFFMLRGNHECRQLTSFFNFKDECIYKYDVSLYDAIMDSFDCLPLAAKVEDTFFCVHGGISPEIKLIKEINDIDRFKETPREGKMCDLLWSDPHDDDKEKGGSGGGWFDHNEVRQCSYLFGIEAVKKFNRDNKVCAIIRAHEAQQDGYKMHMINQKSHIPRIITIFSAPNYCDVYKNKAVVLKLNHNVMNIKQFQEAPHPYYLPNFMDVFQWSMPFVAEKVTEMLNKVLDMDDDSDEDEETESAVSEERKQQLRNKVRSVSKLLRMYKLLRQNNEAILQLKQLTPNNKVPFGLLSQGQDAIQASIAGFDNAKKADMVNEALPPPV